MPLILIFIINAIVFILSLIGVIAAYFERKWKWFIVILICVILSAAGVAMELGYWFLPSAAQKSPVYVRQALTPL